MGRTRNAFRFEYQDVCLEHRVLLSQSGLSSTPALVAGLEHNGLQAAHERFPHGGNPFHRNGINGLVLHQAFVNQLNDRLKISKDMTHRIFEAFQVFAQAYQATPFDPAADGTGSRATKVVASSEPPQNLQDLLADLEREVDSALSTIEIHNNQVRPSRAKAAKFTPDASKALIPYAHTQIQILGETLASLPSGAGTGGSSAAVAAALNTSYNAILNSVAEDSLHPNLFQQQSDFYISPDVTFTVSFDDTPAKAGPGYFVRGPGGKIIPGAILPPHFPLKSR